MTPIVYYQCECGCHSTASEPVCPKCGEKVKVTPTASPGRKELSPIPWWGSMLCIIVGIGAWIASALLNIASLGEASRLLVYAPLGHLFSMSIRRG